LILWTTTSCYSAYEAMTSFCIKDVALSHNLLWDCRNAYDAGPRPWGSCTCRSTAVAPMRCATVISITTNTIHSVHWSRWLKVMACRHICTQTILRFTVPEVLLQSTTFHGRSPSMSAQLPAGRSPAGCMSLHCDKTEVRCASASGRRQHQLSSTVQRSVNWRHSLLTHPVKSTNDLSIDIHRLWSTAMQLRTHVQRTVSRCFAVVRQLRKFRRSVPIDTFQTL